MNKSKVIRKVADKEDFNQLLYAMATGKAWKSLQQKLEHQPRLPPKVVTKLKLPKVLRFDMGLCPGSCSR